MSAVWSNELMTMQKYIADQNRHKHVWVSELLTALQAVIEMQLLIVFLHIETDIFEAWLNIQISNVQPGCGWRLELSRQNKTNNVKFH